MLHRRLIAPMAAITVLLGTLAGCSGGDAAPAASDATTGPITVFAAASLTSVLTELADDFEAAEPGTEVDLSFAGSSDLATQIENGAPADVFASADTATMDRIAEAGLTSAEPVVVATNTLEIAVPPGNPAGIASLADLARPGAATVVCAEQVPCGAATARVTASAGVRLSPVSEESSVTDVLGKVRSGEADAGLVYVTDVLGAGDAVEGIPFAESASAVNDYPFAALTGSSRPAVAEAFVAYVASPAGRAVLEQAGFGLP